MSGTKKFSKRKGLKHKKKSHGHIGPIHQAVGVALRGGASSESSDGSEDQTSSDYEVYSPRQLRSSRSDDSDRERRVMRDRKLRPPVELLPAQNEVGIIAPAVKRRKMSPSQVKMEPK